MDRRRFIKAATVSSCAIANLNLISCVNKTTDSSTIKSKELKISLAQWSLHKQLQAGTLDPTIFAETSKQKFNINAIEYVSQFYKEKGSNLEFWKEMKSRAIDNGVTNLLIMVDDEGDLAIADKTMRDTSVENHYKWVNAAKELGCHSVRVNAFGEENVDDFMPACVDGMGKLCEYAEKEDINVIIENHGLFSSNAELIVEIIKQVNNPYLGTLPDFGNWCTSTKWGGIENNDCEIQYDIYKGVKEYLPYAKGVSAKAYNFSEQGDQEIIDYHKMIKLVKESDFTGHIGIEYEGDNLSEEKGIIATKKLLEKVWEAT